MCASSSQPARCAPCRPIVLKDSTNNCQHSIEIFLPRAVRGQCCRQGDKHPARLRTCPSLGGRARNGNQWPEVQDVQSLMSGCTANRGTVRESEPQWPCEHGTVRGEDPNFSSRTSYFLNELGQPPDHCSTLTSQMPSNTLGCCLLSIASH